MCTKNNCFFPEKLQKSPEFCTPEQIKECHGEEKEHDCVQKKEPATDTQE